MLNLWLINYEDKLHQFGSQFLVDSHRTQCDRWNFGPSLDDGLVNLNQYPACSPKLWVLESWRQISWSHLRSYVRDQKNGRSERIFVRCVTLEVWKNFWTNTIRQFGPPAKRECKRSFLSVSQATGQHEIIRVILPEWKQSITSIGNN